MQAGLYLTATRGTAVPEVRICYERAESLCHSLARPRLLYAALIGQWRYSLQTEKLTATMQIAKRVYSLARDQDDSALMIGAYRSLAVTFYYLGDLESARRYAMRGVQIGAPEASSLRSKSSPRLPSPVCPLRPCPMAFRRDRFLPRYHGGGRVTSKRAQ